MTAHEIPDVLTPLTSAGVWNALLLRWETLGVPVRRVAVELKLAHIHLETGLKKCHCWNLGNLKWKQGQSWTYFACGEEIPAARLAAVQRMSPGNVAIKARYCKGNGSEWCSIWLVPPHPWTKFAAFDTLLDGVDAQLEYLRRHPVVLAALQTGDAAEYNDALHDAEYYTAGKAQYLAELRRRLEIVRGACRDLDWGDVT